MKSGKDRFRIMTQFADPDDFASYCIQTVYIGVVQTSDISMIIFIKTDPGKDRTITFSNTGNFKFPFILSLIIKAIYETILRTNQDIPIKLRAKVLKKLGEECGRETDHRTIFKAKHRDGRMLTPEEFSFEYGIAEARFWTYTPDLLSKQGKRVINEELKQELKARGYKL